MTIAAPVRRRLGAALLVAALACLLALVPTGPSTGTAHASTDSTLTIGELSEVSTFNPFLAYEQGELDPIALLYPTLVWPNEKNVPSPYLATSWTVSSNKLTWTFHLKTGLKWSDGTPLTAHDVAWTLNLIMHNATAATANGALVANFASVTAPNDATVVVTTKTPQSNMLYDIGLPIVPEHIWAGRVKNLANVNNLSTPLVGYGPYTLKNYQTDQYTTMSANKSFFLGAPKYDTLVLQYFKSDDAAVAALKSGQVDQVDNLTAADYRALSQGSNPVTYQQVGYRWTGVELNPGARSKSGKLLSTNTANPALANPVVRRAIAYGIDRPELVQKVLDGLGQVGSAYLPPAFPQWNWRPSASQTIGYDPSMANQLLTQQGYKMGSGGIRTSPTTGKPLVLRLGIHSDTTSDAQIANYLQGWMKAIGIKLEIQSMSSTTLNANLAKGDWDMLMDGWGTGADPTYLLSIQTCGVLPNNQGQDGNTDSFFCNKTYDRLYAEQQETFNQAARAKLIDQMQQILYSANQDIILYYQNDLAAISKSADRDFIYGTKNSKGFYPLQNYKLSWMRALPPSTSSSSGSDTGLIVTIVVVVVIVLAAGGFFAVRRRTVADDRE